MARLVPGPAGRELELYVTAVCAEIRELALGIARLRELTPRTLDQVMGFGERLSCRILAAALSAGGLEATAVDSRQLIKTDLTYGSARVNFDLTNWNILNWFSGTERDPGGHRVPRVGEEQRDHDAGAGRIRLYGRHSRRGAGRGEIQIWTDVNGVMTADPSKVRTPSRSRPSPTRRPWSFLTSARR